MKRLILVILSGLVALYILADTGTAIVDKFISTFEKSTSLTFRYSMIVDNDSTSGIMCIKGDKFKINSAPIAIWYDGTTQWTYVADNGEVSITEPTPEEIAEINPFVVINNFSKGCKAELIKTTSTHNVVVLTPLSPESGLKQIVVSFDKKTTLPTEINILPKSAPSLSLVINSVTRDINYPVTTFVFDKNKYPKTTIVDLR